MNRHKNGAGQYEVDRFGDGRRSGMMDSRSNDQESGWVANSKESDQARNV